MDHFKALSETVFGRIWLGIVLVALVPIGIWQAGTFYHLNDVVLAVVGGAGLLAASLLIARGLTHMALEPIKNVRLAILYVNSDTSNEAAPDIDKIHTGREMVSALVLQIYEMARRAGQSGVVAALPQSADDGLQILNMTPLPLLAVNSASQLHFMNDAALTYLGLDASQRQNYTGKSINDLLNMSFPSELTYESWLADCQKNVIKANTSWKRVRLVDENGNPTKQFDLAASYSKGAGEAESIVVLFDHTTDYAADDQEIGFVAMAVHELRTPLTIMRGYIEVFEDELGPTLPPELKDFMHKMNASAQQLTAFVSNILNVARIEENQLVLTLHKEDLSAILSSAVADLELRAQVHGKHIVLQIAPGLPAVAADRISIHEVINNLVDNAIKYGGKSDTINIFSTLNGEGMVETSVQDFGVGIPESVVTKLFDKFYRSHRSRVQIGGTGLGLYLCKALVSAHGGNIWVNSREGESSIFTFTLEAYNEAQHGAEAQGQNGIMRGAHGWIKNHSMYRR